MWQLLLLLLYPGTFLVDVHSSVLCVSVAPFWAIPGPVLCPNKKSLVPKAGLDGGGMQCHYASQPARTRQPTKKKRRPDADVVSCLCLGQHSVSLATATSPNAAPPIDKGRVSECPGGCNAPLMSLHRRRPYYHSSTKPGQAWWCCPESLITSQVISHPLHPSCVAIGWAAHPTTRGTVLPAPESSKAQVDLSIVVPLCGEDATHDTNRQARPGPGRRSCSGQFCPQVKRHGGLPALCLDPVSLSEQ